MSEFIGLAYYAEIGRATDLPLFVQISRFDRFKDPLGVIAAFRLLRRHRAARLVLAGGSATDDPEGQQVLAEVRQLVGEDPDVLVLELPPDANLEVTLWTLQSLLLSVSLFLALLRQRRFEGHLHLVGALPDRRAQLLGHLGQELLGVHEYRVPAHRLLDRYVVGHQFLPQQPHLPDP